MFYSSQEQPLLMKLYSFLISWVNFKVGIDVCYFKGAGTYWKTWLQLVFPLCLILLIIMTIIVSKQWSRNQGDQGSHCPPPPNISTGWDLPPPPHNNQDTVYIISVLRTYNLNRSMTIRSHLAYNLWKFMYMWTHNSIITKTTPTSYIDEPHNAQRVPTPLACIPWDLRTWYLKETQWQL